MDATSWMTVWLLIAVTLCSSQSLCFHYFFFRTFAGCFPLQLDKCQALQLIQQIAFLFSIIFIFIVELLSLWDSTILQTPFIFKKSTKFRFNFNVAFCIVIHFICLERCKSWVRAFITVFTSHNCVVIRPENLFSEFQWSSAGSVVMVISFHCYEVLGLIHAQGSVLHDIALMNKVAI